MLYRIMAHGVLVIHIAFVLFVAAGVIMVYHRLKLVWMHLPCVAWGVLIEFCGWICPLTPLENYLLDRGAADGYEGDFVGRYLISIIYPQMLTRQIQILMGTAVLGINMLGYAGIWLYLKKKEEAYVDFIVAKEKKHPEVSGQKG